MKASPKFSNVPWWLSPIWLSLFFILPVFVSASLFGVEARFSPAIVTVNFLTPAMIAIGAGSIFIFALGGLVCKILMPPGNFAPSVLPLLQVNKALMALGTLAVTMNVLMFISVFSNVDLLLQMLSGQQGAANVLARSVGRIPGVTSLVQAQLLFFSLFSIARLQGDYRPAKAIKAIFWILIGFTCIRAVVAVERIALVEVALSFGLALIAFRWKSSPLRTLFPFVAIVPLFTMFAVGEYFRSWQAYKMFGTGYLEFVFDRFLNYFATSANNGAGLMTMYPPSITPGFTVDWFYRFPLWQFFGYQPTRPLGMDTFLRLYANPEYNNPGGPYVALIDYGLIGGLLFMGLLGALSWKLFQSFSQRRVAGLILYPIWFVGCFDMIRIFYWGEARFFPVVVLAVPLILFLNNANPDKGQPKVRAGFTPSPRFRTGMFLGMFLSLLLVPQMTKAAPVSSAMQAMLARKLDVDEARGFHNLQNVREWGVRGDGKSDDTAALQAAFNRVGEGSVLFFPAGKYCFSATLRLQRSNIVLWGYGAELAATNPDDSSVWIEGNHSAILGFTLTGGDNNRNQRSRSAKLMLRGAGNQAIDNRVRGGRNIGIGAMRASGFRIAGNFIEQTMADGIHIGWASKRGIVANNIVTRAGDDLIAVVSFGAENLVSDILIENNSVYDTAWGRGIAVIGGENVTIRGNSISDIHYAGGIRVAREPQYKTAGVRNILIEGNILTHIQTRGLLLAKAGGRRTGQGAFDIYSYDEGDAVFRVSDVMIRNNIASDVAGNGVFLLGDGVCGVSVRDNDFHAIRGDLFRVANSSCPNDALSCDGNALDGLAVIAGVCQSAAKVQRDVTGAQPQ